MRKVYSSTAPLTKKDTPIFNAIVFAISDCGFLPRCSLESDDGSEVRINKLLDMIAQCQYAIHDISRIQPDRGSKLPRFNMPLELGIFLGQKAVGDVKQKKKCCLIFDTEKYRPQKFMSDIAGQDPHAHNDDPKTAVKELRKWLATNSPGNKIPGSVAIWNRYQRFSRQLPAILRGSNLPKNEVPFVEYTYMISDWLKDNT
jgi:hypothetical protein